MKDYKHQPKFPKDFLWGASTAAHQVEGGLENQWAAWELANASELAKSAKQRLEWIGNWDDIKAQATNPANYVSGRGVEHYQRYKDDFALLKELNLNAFRFGIEWSRLQPAEGEWDEAAIEHYKKYIQQLRHKNIEPVLNIWHWTMPTWFTDKGGFSKSSNLHYFDAYVQKIADELCVGVKYVITLNEPNVYTSFGYLTGEWPPQKKNVWQAISTYRNLVKAHRSAYRILKAKKSSLQVGLAAQLANIQPKRPHNLLDTIATFWMRYYWNWWFLNRVKKQQDFIGFNYYFTDYYKGFKRDNPPFPTNDLGWYMEPEGLHALILRVWYHYKKPILITENGLADANDEHRKWWIEETILAIERAMSEGVDIRGYMHWSLLDNFEWAYGWWPKFGLVEVDRQNDMKRTIRPSGRWYGEMVKRLTK